MMSPENLRERYSDPLDIWIRSALQGEVSQLELPCAWKQIKKRVWRLRRERQPGWAHQDVYCVESLLPFSVRADMSYFLMTNSVFLAVR